MNEKWRPEKAEGPTVSLETSAPQNPIGVPARSRRKMPAFYVGDYDPSGMFMSERDLPERLVKYGGMHVEVRRIATVAGITNLPTFPASDKKSDPRHAWFISRYGDRCCELDAMDPNDLRACVEAAIRAEIEPIAWARCLKVNKAEQESLRSVLDSWRAS